MRKGPIAAGLVVAAAVGFTAAYWGSLKETYAEIVAMAGEVATDSGRELGRVSYHSLRCGDAEMMTQSQAAMDQLDSKSDFQASLREAFYQGIAEAQGQERDYTQAYCAEVAELVQSIQN